MSGAAPCSFQVAGEVFEVQIADWEARSRWDNNPDSWNAECDRRVMDFLSPDGQSRWSQLRAEGKISDELPKDIFLWLMGQNRASRRAWKRRRGRS